MTDEGRQGTMGRAVAIAGAVVLAACLIAASSSAAAIKAGKYVGSSNLDADQTVSFKVKKVEAGKNGNKKRKITVKNFSMQSVTMPCTAEGAVGPWPVDALGPPPADVRPPVPYGSTKVNFGNGRFSNSKRSHPNPDAGIVGKVAGKLKSGGRAQGTFKARFYDYYLTCNSGTQNWTAQRMASRR